MNYKSKIRFILITIVLLVIISSYGYAENNDDHKKVYVIVANKLVLEDITYMQNLEGLVRQNSIGLMNTKGTNNANNAEGFLTINSSSRSYGRRDYSKAFNLIDDNLELYKTRVGFIENNKYQIGNIEINRIIEGNSKNAYNSNIGALGDSLHNVGLKTALFGNSDTDENPIRMASLIPMDSKGLIDYGDIENVVIKDKSYPYGLRTDYKKILSGIDDVKDKASLIVIDVGDLNRLASYNNNLNDETFKYHRINILKEIDNFIKELSNNVDENSMIMIISPNIENERLVASSLSPIMILKNKNEGSTLTSGTTRRDGIITNLDIAPTITSFLGIPTSNFLGHNITSKEINNNIENIKTLDIKVNLVSNLRSNFLTLYNVIIIMTIILFLILLYLNQLGNNKLTNIAQGMSLSILTIPAILLVVSIFNIESQIIYIISTISLFIVINLILNLIKKENKAWIVVITNYIILALDISTGGGLIKNSVMGYDPIIGARYFGIGNELVGILLPSMALITALTTTKTNKRYPLILLIISTILVGHPSFGANVGGTMSILFTAIILVLLYENFKINFKKLIVITCAIVLIILLMGIIDITFNENPTHLGKTILMISQNGPKYLTTVIIRKVQVNIKLMKTSSWAKVLYSCLIFMGILTVFFKNIIKSIFNKERHLKISLVSIFTGNIIGFLLNDSGLLLSAISMSFVSAFMMYYIINYKKDNRI